MVKKRLKVFAVLLAGGSGSRLWPLSRELYPKQLLSLIGDETLVQSSVKRILPLITIDNLRIVCGKLHFHEIEKQLKSIRIPTENKIIVEPCGRNTAPAILLCVLSILKSEKDALIVVLPSDHIVSDLNEFQNTLKSGINYAERDFILTFGIKPYYPDTNYGYIEAIETYDSKSLFVRYFHEKPDKHTAEEFVKAGNYFWNSGIFVFKASTIVSEFKKYQPVIFETMSRLFNLEAGISLESYEKLPNISIDYAIMEKTKRCLVIPSNFGWSDLGSWKSLYDFLPKDYNNNVTEGDVVTRDTRNSMIASRYRLVVTNGLEGMAIVETDDAVLVSNLDKSMDLKSLIELLKSKGRKELQAHSTINRPWGYFKVLEENNGNKIKRIVVLPGAKLSLQMHHHRSEHWIVVEGTARVINGGERLILNEGQYTYIPKRTIHRLENPNESPLHVIEIQTGNYLEEDDIVRFEDDFGRVNETPGIL